jgi:hypothetical protein
MADINQKNPASPAVTTSEKRMRIPKPNPQIPFTPPVQHTKDVSDSTIPFLRTTEG